MKQKIFLFALLLLAFTLSGCWDQKIINRKLFVGELGLETAPNSQLLFTMVAARTSQSGIQGETVLATQSNLVSEGTKMADLIAPEDIELVKLRHVLFAEKLAVQGIHPWLEVFERNPLMPLQSYLIVVEGQPSQLLKRLTVGKDRPPLTHYLSELLKRNIQQAYLPECSLGEFEIAYFAPGIDPLVPLLKLTAEGASVTGSALFANDRMVGKLNPWQTALLLTMMNRFKPTQLFFSLPAESINETPLKKGIAISITKARSQITQSLSGGVPEFKIRLQLQGILQENRWNHLDQRKQQTQLEHQIAAEIQTACQTIIRILQQTGSDPLGLGNRIRANDQAYRKKIKWSHTYRHFKIAIEIHFKLLNYGLIH